MTSWPRISIVTPSFNQGKFIKETVDSVLAQGYPNIEHIVVDGASTDDTLSILGRYTHLHVISEPDKGQAEAINKGFRLATGDILGFLNSDDTLLPDALIWLAGAMGKGSAPDIVMGRCHFVDEEGHFIGIEHPSCFVSHLRVLQVWKGHFIPQPAVFWRREVWERCGGMDEKLGSQWIDYDLFCRFSMRYRFEPINQPLATYRLHDHSKSMRCTEDARLEEAIRISRKYWGPVWSLRFWRLATSLLWFRLDRVGRARQLIALAKEAKRQGKIHRAWICAVPALLLAPDVAFYRIVYPALRERALGSFKSALDRWRRLNRIDPRTAVYMDHTDVWEDGRVGPHLVLRFESIEKVKSILITGEADLSYLRQPFSLNVSVNDRRVGLKNLKENGPFSVRFDLKEPAPSGQITVEIRASSWFVPHFYFKNGDLRPISWRFQEVSLNREM